MYVLGQRSINQLVEALFGVETGFVGVLVSNLAKAHGVTNTPLTPYMDKELLGHNHLYVDGTKIETTGFEYTYPSVQLDQVRALVQDAIDQRMFPPVLA
ncbi:hypothetical protein DYB28_009079 [Aphanomyces astaci]|uniref:Uncharacterized protein n=1 Tax=Aphanomyces astaci TaxID=112090 RepID=A0A397F0L1_APHAT|nr:hypothetical protein DYB30_013387 [Aphanomyces astaci]RHZ05140.1 hypothetical protein DYB31_010993 [Aphanomyces astaci]RHZ42529.1 hypothetical protein DYB26_009382 [Aphanomyces astaci]RLO04637.1 hypothetical protein DYB28_009079 [Aphanomyces astaci]